MGLLSITHIDNELKNFMVYVSLQKTNELNIATALVSGTQCLSHDGNKEQYVETYLSLEGNLIRFVNKASNYINPDHIAILAFLVSISFIYYNKR